ncbi:MAG: hypothetical protein M3680_05775 [Myxococcota bacterium]|nr:hypothetical protein [Myxococcota bacterium]
MGILPRAPKVEVFAPTTLFVGATATIEVVIHAEDATKIDGIEARIVGSQGWRINGIHGYDDDHHVTYPELVAQLMGPGVLPAGTSRFHTTFTVPVGTPPSHAIAPADASIEARIWVAIPWWPDGRYAFRLPVRLPPPATVMRSPIVCASSRTADQPRLELSLASTRLIAGETLVGSCAVFHMDDAKPREIEIQLVPVLELLGREGPVVRRGDALELVVTVPAGGAGAAVPFRCQLPPNLTPSFEAVTHKLDWWLEARTGSFFRGTVELAVPLELVDQSATATTARLVRAPHVADERVAAVFTRFAAQRGWRSAPAIGDGEPVIELERGDATISLAYEYRGKAGTFLVGRVGYRPLGLGLNVTPSSPLREVFWRDIEVDLAAWDRDHHVVARSPAQTIPVLRAVVPALLRAASCGQFVRWDDSELVLQRPVEMVEEANLSELQSALTALVDAIATARALVTPPAGIEVDVAAWQDLARGLRGRLTVGDLSVEGELDGLPVDLHLVWSPDGQPASVRVAVGSPHRASELLRQISVSLARPAADALGEPAAEPLVAQLIDWPAAIRDLQVADGVARATWQLPGGAAPIANASQLRELVGKLRGVLATLDPGAGPYR